MRNWKELYKEAEKELNIISKNVKGVLIGFNVNIDKIICLSSQILEQVLEKLDKKLVFKEQINSRSTIETKEELVSNLIHSIEKGIADEKLITSKKIAKWIEEQFLVQETSIGGQAGIMANTLAGMGLNNVTLSLPILSQKLINLLDPRISIFKETGQRCTIGSLPNLNEEEDPIIHYSSQGEPFECQLNNSKHEVR